MTDARFARRLVPARPDLAAGSLRGVVEAARFAEGVPHSVTATLLDLRTSPEPDTGVDTRLFRGETFTVYEIRDGLAWGQSETDGYVGHVATAGLGAFLKAETLVTALWSHVYPEPDMKMPPLAELPCGARLAVAGTTGRFARLRGGGWVPRRHIEPVEGDIVTQAARFLGTPYLWGGRSARGIDCSGLVQMALAATGVEAPRDSDMQQAALGRGMSSDETPRRGDLLFWRGHVAIVADPDTLLHANAHHMAVVMEPLAPALARIEAAGDGKVTGRRRLEIAKD